MAKPFAQYAATKGRVRRPCRTSSASSAAAAAALTPPPTGVRGFSSSRRHLSSGESALLLLERRQGRSRGQVACQPSCVPAFSESSSFAAFRDRVEEEEQEDVSPFFDADENKTYQDKIPPAMLKVDWRFPRPGVLYPLYTRSKFLVGWNAVRILREDDSTDPKVVMQLRRTTLSVFCFCMSWLWYLVPTPLVFLYNKLVQEPLQPLLRRIHRYAIKKYAGLKLGAIQKQRKKTAGQLEGLEEDRSWLSFILQAYHGNVGPLTLLKDSVECIKILLLSK